jgi:hypothetical protein
MAQVVENAHSNQAKRMAQVAKCNLATPILPLFKQNKQTNKTQTWMTATSQLSNTDHFQLKALCNIYAWGPSVTESEDTVPSTGK